MLVSVAEATKKLDLPRSTFNRQVKSLNIPIIKRGDRNFFDEEILEKYFPNKSRGLAKIITYANQKGGIGKSTTCINMGLALSQMQNNSQNNYKILMIDMDPQANLSGQFKDPETIDNSVANVMSLKQHGFPSSNFEDTIIKYNKNLHILPSTIQLAKFDVSRDVNDYDRLTTLTKSVKGIYDFILIDAPPTLNILLLNALVCSDLVIVPSTPSRFSVQGLKDLKHTISSVKEKNPTLKVYGLINRYVQNQQLSAMVSLVENTFPIFKTRIPQATDIEKAQVVQNEHLDTVSPTKFKHYQNLAGEVIDKCQN